MKKYLLPVILLGMVTFAFGSSGVIGHATYDPADSTAAWFPEPSSRGLTAGSDLDGDGKQEVFAANYSYGGIAMAFELAADTSVLELVWFSDTSLTASGSSSGTRMVQTGDLDGDGLGEIIYFRGYAPDPISKPDDGLWIYEYNGTDNGYDMVYHNTLQYLGTDSISTFRPEHFIVDDVDGDGQQELIVASNGTSWGKDRSEDQFTVLSITGNMGTDPFITLVEEFHISARANGNALGGGSAINVNISDIDGDGNKEVYCHAWNSHNNFFFEATGVANEYTLGDTTNVQISAGVGDHVSLMQSAVADMNKDGKDEVYMTNYYTGDVYMITDKNADGATTFSADEVDTLALDIGATFGATAGDFNNDGSDEIVFAGSSGSKGDLHMWDGVSFTSWNSDEVAGGFAAKLGTADLNGNGIDEIVSAHQSVPDSVNGVPNWHRWIVRASEIGAVTTVNNYQVVTPDDYVLRQAYPNPFNPSTTIEFKLPLAKEISLIVYNMRGQEIVRLIDNASYTPGDHHIVWNGLNAQGTPVASGTYIYSLRYGNFQQSKRVTFLK